MAEKLQRIFDLVIEFSFYVLFAIIPLLFTPSTSELFEFPKIIGVYCITIIITSAWIAKSIFAGRFIFRRSILDIPLVLFFFSQLASTIISIDPHTSLWGHYSRFNGGLLSTASYLLLYWAYVSNMNEQKTHTMVKALLASASIISLYAILEHFGHSYSCLILRRSFDTSCWVPKVQERVFATLGQPNWLAAWLVGIIPLGWGLTLISAKERPKSNKFRTIRAFLLAGISLISLAAIFYTKSRSGFLGLGAATVTFVFFLLPKRLFIRGVFLILVLMGGALVWQQSLSDCFDLNPKTLASNGSTESCKIRTIVWEGAIDMWKHYPITGSGVETFGYTYYQFRPVSHNLTSEWNLLYNKAHNEYLNFLSTTGITGLATYLFFIGIAIYSLAKHSKDKLSLALLAGFVSILVTNFFGFSVVVTSLLFFLYPAMSQTLGLGEQTFKQKPKFSLKKLPFLVLLLFPALFCLWSTISFFQADKLYTQAKKDNQTSSPKTAAEKLEQAIRLHPYEPKYYDELSDSTSQIAVLLSEENKAEDAKEFAQLSNELSRESLSISPHNASLWSSRAIYLKRLSGIDPQYLSLTIEALEKAVQLAPTDPTFHLNLAVLYEHAEQPEKAIALLIETIALKPNYNEARDDLARIYIAEGQREKAFEQLQYVLEKIDPRDEEAKLLLNLLASPSAKTK